MKDEGEGVLRGFVRRGGYKEGACVVVFLEEGEDGFIASRYRLGGVSMVPFQCSTLSAKE